MYTSFLGMNELWIGFAHLLGAKIVHIWVYMPIWSHKYIHLHAYTSCKHIYASHCIYWHIYLYLIAYIYVDICVYRCILACIWSHPISLHPLARRVAYDSKGAMQNFQMQMQQWPYFIEFSISIVSWSAKQWWMLERVQRSNKKRK